MKISNPSVLQKFLLENNFPIKKYSSQNFLIDGNIIKKIVQEAQLSPSDLVVEIGPGPGALTEALIEAQCEVIAIEKDAKLASLLKRLQSESSTLEIHNEDILLYPLESVLLEKLKGSRKAKVVANLPYHITTPILAKLVPLAHLISDVVVMVQKEVADRFVARCGTKDYSSFTLFLQYYSHVKYGFTVDANCFYPKPSVQSAVVHLQLKQPPLLPRPDQFFKMTRTAFHQRRKMLRSSLKTIYSPQKVEEGLLCQSLNPQVRPEELSLEQFISLYLFLEKE